MVSGIDRWAVVALKLLAVVDLVRRGADFAHWFDRRFCARSAFFFATENVEGSPNDLDGLVMISLMCLGVHLMES